MDQTIPKLQFSPADIYALSHSKPRHKFKNYFDNLFSPKVIRKYLPPDPIPGKKTLVLDLDETLIHSDEFPPHPDVDYFQIGEPKIYVHKRPGLDKFIKFACKNFEVFTFTYGTRGYAEEILDKICPEVPKDHRLYRELCYIHRSGRVQKNLKILKRKPENLILIDDCNDQKYFNPYNSILIPEWKGTPHDTCLIDIIPIILENCLQAPDVRDIIRKIPSNIRRASF